MDAHLVIARNFPWCDEHDDLSFGGRLHEDCVWNWDEYWQLEWALYQLCNESPSRELYWPVFRIFSYCFASLGHHSDPNDLFRIKNLSAEELYDAKERFQLVFEGFFAGSMPDQDFSEHRNPLLISASG
jgi:hypothetical protein